MALEVDSTPSSRRSDPRPDFSKRLEEALEKADHARARGIWLGRLRRVLVLLVLVVPIVFWRLGGATHDGLGASINALAWLAFLLDVTVHVNTSILSYLGLRALPMAVGLLIFGLVTITLLGPSAEK